MATTYWMAHVPIGRRRHIAYNLLWNIVRHERTHWVADKAVGELDLTPKKVPCVSLRSAGNFNEITSNLDVAPEQDRPLWGKLLRDGN